MSYYQKKDGIQICFITMQWIVYFQNCRLVKKYLSWCLTSDNSHIWLSMLKTKNKESKQTKNKTKNGSYRIKKSNSFKDEREALG